MNVMHHVHQIHVVLMKAAGVPLTHIMSGDQFEKERCLPTMLRYGRTDIFMKYFDAFVQAKPQGVTLHLRHLLKVAIDTNNINVVRHLFKFNRDNKLLDDSSSVINQQIELTVKMDRHDMVGLLLSEFEFVNNRKRSSHNKTNEQISFGRMYWMCQSFKMLQTIHSQCHLFKPQVGPEDVSVQLIRTLTIDDFPVLLAFLRGPSLNANKAFYNILVHHMNNIPLLDCFFSLETFMASTRKYLAYNIFPDREDDWSSMDLLTSMQTPEGLYFAKRYRQHLPSDCIYFAAATHGEVDLAQWTIERQLPAFSDVHVAAALEHGFIDVALYILDNCNVADDDNGECPPSLFPNYNDNGPRTWLLNRPIDDSIHSMELLQRLASSRNITFEYGILLSPGMTLETLEFIKANDPC
ncbi:hypothetical protein SAMD00019534_109380 [Acytostelium subglobosum LB1]|uniref:hypothetical protein n=1 Tax=Acytostelium subglobosum LB1 TaxID=1410327 RepID=UPI0006451EF2|nr:hypothetical protein SAMD00019534_109380 [Acytostelium subglobosum LB1]GAM27762.1 hypothetical protein SAMD00019534_109380 [Acytostelium subglobosum LB1]|eukprot:XP_012749421.1 hypothetical protein SAMD00019534_109380 [Acytostelium subglobosum LB1]